MHIQEAREAYRIHQNIAMNSFGLIWSLAFSLFGIFSTDEVTNQLTTLPSGYSQPDCNQIITYSLQVFGYTGTVPGEIGSHSVRSLLEWCSWDSFLHVGTCVRKPACIHIFGSIGTKDSSPGQLEIKECQQDAGNISIRNRTTCGDHTTEVSLSSQEHRSALFSDNCWLGPHVCWLHCC